MRSTLRIIHTLPISVLLILFLLSSVLNAQTRTASVSGNWNNTATWGGASVPISGNTVVINNAITVTVNVDASCASITFPSENANNTTLNINSGVTLSVTGAVTIPRAETGTSILNKIAVGDGTLNAGSILFTNGGNTVRHQITINTGSVNVTGDVTTDDNGTSATISFSGSGFLKVGGQLMSSGTVGGTLTTFAGSTVEYNGAAQTARVNTYLGNLTLSGSGTKTFATTPTVNGILSMEGTATATVSSGVITYGSSATLQYNTATARTASSEEWISPFLATGGVIIKNTGTITLNAAKQFGSNTNVPLNINSGATLSTSGSNFGLTFHGNFINDGTLTAGSAAVTIAGTTSTQSIAGFTTTGTVSMTKTSGTATLQGNVNGAGLTINGSGGTLNLGSALTHTFTGVVTLSFGTLNGGSSTLNENATSATAWNGTGSVFSAGTGTVNFGGAAHTFSATATTFNIITFSNSGTKTLSSATVANGTVTINSSVTLATANNVLTFGGDFVNSGTFTAGSSAITIAGTATQSIAGFTTTGTVSMTKTGATATFQGNVNGNGLTINGSGGTLNLGTGLTHTFTGTWTRTAGTLNGGSGTLKIGASVSGSAGTFTAGTGTVEWNAAGTQTIAGVTYNNLILSGSGAKTITGSTINGTLSIRGTATASGTTPTYGGSAVLEYKGSSAQTTSNVEFGGTGANPVNITVDNASGVILNAAKSINGALTLSNGYLTTTGNLLTINAGGSASYSNDAFVNGPLAKTGNTAFTFPVGKSGAGIRTIGISAPTVSSTFTAEFFRSDPHAVGTALGSGIQWVSDCEYWTLDRSGTGNARVTLSWASSSTCNGTGGYVTDLSKLRVAHWNGSWTDEGNLSVTGDPSAGTVTSGTVLTSFSPFALGASVPMNPLPIMFTDVKEYEKNGGVQIEWSNMTERDLVNYVVERSSNAETFTAINQQLPRSNRNNKESYSVFDPAPFSGISFYRIKALEISGKIIYSKVLKVDIGNRQQGFTLYPNPVRGNQVSISINTKQGQYTLKVLNTSGREVYSQRIMHQGGSMTQIIELPSTVKPGVYNMIIGGDNHRESKMFVVQ